MGYANALSALESRESVDLVSVFSLILAGHRRLVKGSVFGGTIDEVLCIWGIGTANLLISKGLLVDINDLILPRDLLITNP